MNIRPTEMLSLAQHSTPLDEKRTGHPGTSSAQDQRLKKACQDFESHFLAQMMKTMRQSLPEAGLFGDGPGEKYFTQLFDEEIATRVSRTKGVGIAEALYRDLKGERASSAHASGMTIEAYRKTAQPSWAIADTALGRARRFDRIVRDAARTHGVDPHLIRAVIAQESGGRPGAVSRRGAKGLMQLMDSTAAALGVRDSMDARENILGGTRYLRQLLDRFDGDLKLALASYNAGPSAVARHGGIPPYRETREFVRRVLDYLDTSRTMSGAR